MRRPRPSESLQLAKHTRSVYGCSCMGLKDSPRKFYSRSPPTGGISYQDVVTAMGISEAMTCIVWTKVAKQELSRYLDGLGIPFSRVMEEEHPQPVTEIRLTDLRPNMDADRLKFLFGMLRSSLFEFSRGCTNNLLVGALEARAEVVQGAWRFGLRQKVTHGKS